MTAPKDFSEAPGHRNEEMMEIHLESQMGQNKRIASDTRQFNGL